MSDSPAVDLTWALGGKYVVDIEKFWDKEFWSNRYFITASNLSEAADTARAIAAAERAITSTVVQFTKGALRTVAENDELYRTVVLNFTGQRVPPSDLLPLFAVARFDIEPNSGRASRKYLRGVLHKADIGTSQIISSMVTFFNTNYTAKLLAIPGYVDVDGQSFVAGGCNVQVGQRQLRRGSKKKNTPSTDGTTPSPL